MPRIVAGTIHENPVTLTRQDWRGPRASWREDSRGEWQVEVARAGNYEVTVRMPVQTAATTARLHIGKLEVSQPLPAGTDHVVFPSVRLEAGLSRVEATVERADETVGAHYVDLLCQEPISTP